VALPPMTPATFRPFVELVGVDKSCMRPSQQRAPMSRKGGSVISEISCGTLYSRETDSLYGRSQLLGGAMKWLQGALARRCTFPLATVGLRLGKPLAPHALPQRRQTSPRQGAGRTRCTAADRRKFLCM
jgi:hypothetical protein